MKRLKKILAAGSLALFCGVFQIFAAQTTVEQWGVCEITLPGPTNGNPFLDVRFAARFAQDDDFIAKMNRDYAVALVKGELKKSAAGGVG
jgi:hypothetical protein